MDPNTLYWRKHGASASSAEIDSFQVPVVSRKAARLLAVCSQSGVLSVVTYVRSSLTCTSKTSDIQQKENSLRDKPVHGAA